MVVGCDFSGGIWYLLLTVIDISWSSGLLGEAIFQNRLLSYHHHFPRNRNWRYKNCLQFTIMSWCQSTRTTILHNQCFAWKQSHICALKIYLYLSFLIAWLHVERQWNLADSECSWTAGSHCISSDKISRVFYLLLSLLDSSHTKDVFYFLCIEE